MTESLCLNDLETREDIRLTEEEVVALMLNMIAFDGDWNAHLKFLNGLDDNLLWKYEQIPLVRQMQRRDAECHIQDVLSLNL